VEYVGVVLLVALVLAAAIAGLSVTGTGAAVVRAIERALCVVAGGPCGEPERACVVSSHREHDHGQVTVASLRMGEDTTFLRERRSDGSIALTLVHDRSGGIDTGWGAGVHAELDGLSVGFGREFRAAVLAHAREGRTYVARDANRAEALERDVRLAALVREDRRSIEDPNGSLILSRPAPRLPEPEESFHEASVEAALAAFVPLGRRATATGKAEAERAWGERREHATGRRTIYVRSRAELELGVALDPAGRRGAEAGGAIEQLLGITVDRDGRPLDLEVLEGRTLHAGVEPPAVLARGAALLGAPTSVARRLEIEQHLDLSDPANAETARSVLEELRRPAGAPADLAAGPALRARLEAAGRTQMRAYALDGSSRSVEGHAGVELKFGFETGSSTEDARLLGASERLGTGPWRVSADCRPA
jgi:hypothetical protein